LKNSPGFLTAKQTNECVLNKAGVKRKLLNTIKARKLAYNGHTEVHNLEFMKEETVESRLTPL